MTNGSIYEFVTKAGVSYIGTLKTSNDSGTYEFDDVLTIMMRPVQLPDGQMTMAPAMDLVGIFTHNSVFSIHISDLYMIEEVKYSAFIDMYKANVKMYSDAKIMHGSNIEIADKMPQSPESTVQRKR